MILISNFLFKFIKFCVIVNFFDSITSIIYFIFNRIKSSLVAKLVTLGISALNSFTSALRVGLVISGIYLQYFLSQHQYIFFNNTIFYNITASNLSTLLFKLLKLVGRFFNLAISNLSSLYFSLAKATFLAKDYVSIPAAFFKSVFVA